MMITVGLTGGFGTGKTTVLGFFKRTGACVLSADDLVHRELETNGALRKKIQRLFGEAIFQRGKLNRSLLAQRVFANSRDLKKLDALIHPLVGKRILTWMKKYDTKGVKSIGVVEVPLLFEAGFDKFFDVTIGVATNPKIQRERLLKTHKFSLKDISQRLKQQLSQKEKMARCDFLIDNSADKKKTELQVKKIAHILRKI